MAKRDKTSTKSAKKGLKGGPAPASPLARKSNTRVAGEKAGGERKTKPVKAKGPRPAADDSGDLELSLEKSEGVLPVVGIGASAGGLEAFTHLLGSLPSDTGMAFVLVTHLSHQHKSMLPELLARSTQMPVAQVTKTTTLEPNHVYVMPPNVDLEISGGDIRPKPLSDGHRPHMAIDFFFRSLARGRGNRAIGVVLSGTGTDGTLGLAAIKAEGGITLVQDEESAKFPDMPRSASAGAAGADFVLPPEGIAVELGRIARHPYVSEVIAAKQVTKLSQKPEDEIAQIFRLVAAATGVDFSQYKPTTIRRRISRRMLLHRIESFAGYVKFLRSDAVEVEALYDDLLINVTGFFRDPQTFEALEKKVIPKTLKNRRPGSPIRVWSAGCATGEEVYSLAICLLEALEDLGSNPPLQIFGTDVSPMAIRRAREGIYPESIAIDVSPQRLRRFFVKTAGGYQISNLVRDLCVFAPQNVAKDPPFSRLDLISCRNLLIYFGPFLQKKVLTSLHYALKPSGFLLLGTSETVGAASELFQLADKKQKIYSKIQTAIQPHFDLGGKDLEIDREAVPAKAVSEVRQAMDLGTEIDRIILSKYAPAGVVINSALEIVQFRGHTSSFLEPAPGEASLALLKMAREGLLIDLRAAIHQAKKTHQASRKESLRIRSSETARHVNLEVIPLRGNGLKEDYYLVLFEQRLLESPEPAAARFKRRDAKLQAAENKIAALRDELASTQADLHAIIEEQEASNEELQSANEEILSSNEELQSTNEEMETAKEELQATNEELTTVNEEMQNRNAEMTQANNDLINLVGAVDIMILMLGTDLRIRRFTPTAQRVMNLIPGDVGRPLNNIKSNLKVPGLEELIAEVIDTVSVKELEVQDSRGRWYSMRIRPYKTIDNRIDGAVMVLVDIDDLKQAQRKLSLLSKVFVGGSDPIIIHDPQGQIIDLNEEAARAYGWSRADLIGKSIKTVIPPDSHEDMGQLWERCKKAHSLSNVESERWTKGHKRIPVHVTLDLLTDETGEPVALASIAKAR